MVYRFNREGKLPFYENHLFLGGRNATEDIRVNSRYLLRNGKPWIPIMGEIHYMRLAREEWETELARMKAGGITVVSCYVVWIYHEEEEGKFNFSGNRNLRRFIELCAKSGLKVILRIGPWVHGEVRNGGFPDWLLQKDFAVRCNDAGYLAYVRRYYEQIQQQIDSMLFYDNGPVWAIQLENELVNQGEHLLTLRRMAEEVGLRVPVYTVTGWNAKYGAEIPEYEVLPVFGGYPEAPWEQHKEKLEPCSNYFFLPVRNDSAIGKDLLGTREKGDSGVFHMRYELYPFATCELGGGMQVTHHRRPVMGRDDVAALSLVKLGCGNNLPGYYMYHGGVNDISGTTLQESRATGYPNDYPIRNYDFQAPVGQYGQVRDSCRQLKKQNLFVQSFMEELACMDAYFQQPGVRGRMDKTSLRYSVRTNGRGGFVFVNNFQRLDALAEHEDVQFEVPCEGGAMVFPKEGMTIRQGVYGIFPYHLPLGDMTLLYATVQPLYRKEHTWFFCTIRGVVPEYCVFSPQRGGERIFPQVGKDAPVTLESAAGEIRLVLLDGEEADYFYVLDDEIYLTDGADMYKTEAGVTAYQRERAELAVWRWTGKRWDRLAVQAGHGMAPEAKAVPYREFVPQPERYAHASELFLDAKKRVKGYRLEGITEIAQEMQDGFLQISYTGDVLQVYADGVLAADDFCLGEPFEIRLSSLLRYGSGIEILISEMLPGTCYMEKGGCGLELKQIRWIPEYSVFI